MNIIEKKIWNYLTSAGLNAYGAAGLMGNLYAESGLRSNNLQNSYEGKLGYTDAEYTELVDHGTYTNFANDRAGYGLCQWTYPTRKAALLAYAKAAGKSIGDLEMQLGFLLQELTNYGLLNALKTAGSVRAASDLILLKFEKPASMNSAATQTKRAGYGQTYYDKYAAGQVATGGTKMNRKPVSYLQTDPRWKNKPYQVKGETATIGDSGCGPTAAAMLIETLTGKTFTPEDACNWSLAHGYKALGNGTYYAYFAPQFAAHGIKCWQLSWTNVYHNPKSKIHDQALEYLKQGYYLIALMKKGTWTGGGHFVVVWWADDKIRINDPASTKDNRLNGDINTFRNEAAYYWVIDARAHNNGSNKNQEEDDNMTQDQFNKMFNTAMQQYRQGLRDNDSGEWSKEARQFAVDEGIFAGSGTVPDGNPNFMWEDFLTREQCAQVLYRFAKKYGLA